MPGSGGVVTRLLSEFREGNQEAANQLVPLVYGELRTARPYSPGYRAG